MEAAPFRLATPSAAKNHTSPANSEPGATAERIVKRQQWQWLTKMTQTGEAAQQQGSMCKPRRGTA